MLCKAQLARGFAALSAGRFADAYSSLRRTFDPADPAYHHGGRLWALAEYVEAAALSGHRAEASAIVEGVRSISNDGADAVAPPIPSFLVDSLPTTMRPRPPSRPPLSVIRSHRLSSSVPASSWPTAHGCGAIVGWRILARRSRPPRIGWMPWVPSGGASAPDRSCEHPA